MSNSTLKLLAVLFMLIDHAGVIFFPGVHVLRVIGRMSFPIFAFLLVEGCNRTKNYKKYLFSLLMFAIVTQVPFKLAFNSNITNVFFTLFLGALMIYFIKLYKEYINSCNYIVSAMICLLFAVISLVLKTDYCFTGIIMLYLIYEFNFIGCFLGCLILDYFSKGFCYSWLSLFIIYFYNKKRGLNLKYFFYLIYPLHLIIYYLIKVVFL